MTDPKLDYTSRVYSALKDNLQGFDKTPAQFLDAMQDSDYRSRVYSALKDNLQGFNKSQDEFNNLVVPQKKNSGTSVPSKYVAAPEQDDSAPSSNQSGSAAPSTSNVIDPNTYMRQTRPEVQTPDLSQNPIDLINEADQLAAKRVAVNSPSTGGLSMGTTTNTVYLPDDKATAQAKQINDYLAEQKIDVPAVRNLFSDFPKQAYDYTNPDGTKPQSKDALWQQYLADPMKTRYK